MSFDSYTIPVAKDGTLPVTLFGRPLNFKRVKEQGIKWLICVAEQDDLVEKESALAPLDWVEAEVTVFPKGHVAMATSWSLPTTECSLDRCFLDYRGPVRFQLDMEAEADQARTVAAPKKQVDKIQLPAVVKPEPAKAQPAAAEKPEEVKAQSTAPIKEGQNKGQPGDVQKQEG